MDALIETARLRARAQIRRAQADVEARYYKRYRPERIPRALTLFSLLLVPGVTAVTPGLPDRW
jgi:hypothetical protein